MSLKKWGKPADILRSWRDISIIAHWVKKTDCDSYGALAFSVRDRESTGLLSRNTGFPRESHVVGAVSRQDQLTVQESGQGTSSIAFMEKESPHSRTVEIPENATLQFRVLLEDLERKRLGR